MRHAFKGKDRSITGSRDRPSNSGKDGSEGPDTDLEQVRAILEEGYEELGLGADALAYGEGPAYDAAYQDALAAVPDGTPVGELEELYTDDSGGDATVVLRYGASPGREDWVERYARRLGDELGL